MVGKILGNIAGGIACAVAGYFGISALKKHVFDPKKTNNESETTEDTVADEETTSEETTEEAVNEEETSDTEESVE